MALLTEGHWPCKILDGSFGDTGGTKPKPSVARINAEITDGPNKGRRCTYEEQVNGKSALYVGRCALAVGWKGVSMSTLKADIAAWVAKTGGVSTLEVQHLRRTSDNEPFAKVRSIGRMSRAPIVDAPADRLADADEALARALAEDRAGNSSNNSSGHAGAYDDAPPPDDEDLR